MRQGQLKPAAWVLIVGLGVMAAVVVIALIDTGPTAADFQRLQGRWVRTEGGYILEVQYTKDGNKVTASYFNPHTGDDKPRSINVAQTRAEGEGDVLRLVVVLQDEGYPGSTYTLRYDAPRDELEGTYLQGATQESFPVTFTREK